MPNLKTLKQRIASVKSTKKITGAMKMVATSHLRRAQAQRGPMVHYIAKIESALRLALQELPLSYPKPALVTGRPQGTQLVVVISSDRGLCGNFNMQTVHRAIQHIRLQEQQGWKTQIVCIGKKAHGVFSLLKTHHLLPPMTIDFKRLQETAGEAAAQIMAWFQSKKIDRCSVVYSHFKSVMVSTPQVLALIPTTLGEEPLETHPLFGMEPSAQDMVEDLAKFHLFSHLLGAILETKTSEESARLMAMDHATRNADDMIDRLEVVYNRTRQAYITKELIEIIAGAEAL